MVNNMKNCHYISNKEHQIPTSENPTHESRLLPINLLIYEPYQIFYYDEISTVRNLIFQIPTGVFLVIL